MHNIVSLVSYKGLEECQALIANLNMYSEIDAIIVSAGNSLSQGVETKEKLIIKYSNDNLGFSRGHNINFEHAKTMFPNLNFRFIVLNNDINIIRGFKEFIFSAKPGTVSAPVIQLSDREYGYGRKFDQVFGRNKWLKVRQNPPDWLSGCAMNVSAVDFDSTKFDEKFFIYAEDLKFCLSLRDKVKFKVIIEACIQHHSSSFKEETPKKALYRTILSYRNNKDIAIKFTKYQAIYTLINLVRFIYKITKVILKDYRSLQVLLEICCKPLSNKEIVELAHGKLK